MFDDDGKDGERLKNLIFIKGNISCWKYFYLV